MVKPAPANTAAKQVRVSMHNAYKMNMQQSLKNMGEVQQALVNTLDDTTKEKLNLEPNNEILEASRTVAASQLLELARKISENIRKIERELRAKDLERAVVMSHTDALKTVMSLELPIPAYNANKMPGAEMVKSIERFEENAKNSLRNRLEDMNARGLGEPLSKNKTKSSDSVGLVNGKDNVKDAMSLASSHATYESMRSKNDYVDLWLDHIPPVNQRDPKKVAGRIIKDGARYADRIFIDSWYVIGPFSRSDVKLPPEYGVDLDGVYYGKDNQTLRWQYLSHSSYPITPPQVDKAGVFFGYTEVILDREQDLWVWIGADDFASLSLNEKIIWKSELFNKKFNSLANDKNGTARNQWNLTEYKRLVHFKKGKNSFVFKLTNSDARSFFSLVLTK
ncbi:MAG: hypothetical protein EOO52_07735 [Gammaproteobacteria bacterium]|nr:MAG: hypothetical protein EOO52_07735 [Gammaproteobacteria bacterium]